MSLRRKILAFGVVGVIAAGLGALLGWKFSGPPRKTPYPKGRFE